MASPRPRLTNGWPGLGLQNSIARVSKKARNDIVGKFLSFDSVDWSRTIAYSMGHVGQVYLNRAGREPHGIVTPVEYEQRLAEVMTCWPICAMTMAGPS
jgi:predicted AlkP superfamily phosphohydrolase/phosphomutase